MSTATDDLLWTPHQKDNRAQEEEQVRNQAKIIDERHEQ